MKTSLHPITRHRRLQAFTLTEVMMAMGVVMLVMAAIVTTYVYGLKTVEYIRPKLNASDEARKAVSLLVHEIRSAHLVRIGNGNLSTFSEIPPDTLQIGSAVQIHPTTNLNDFVRYYRDPADHRLKRTTDGSTAAQVVANSISNQMVFTAENYAGRVLTNNYNNRIIGVTLQFYQLQYPTVAIGPGNYYDFYQLRSKITRRTLL
jgi:type II secretory pathway pseudopilin PulG